ncbi:MAG: anhydro-N-acetylmuramic acid kinase, partial [Caldisericaceae bacterium]|nr:anhydro-N-acetylmuramic acid kinase [Caldisericaceae bacterium]
MKAIGMMSGTSLDGITVALASTGLNGENFKILSFETYPFSKKIRAFIEKVIEKGGTEDISFLNFYIGKLYANAVKEFMEEKKISRKEIDVIGMHG